MKPTWEQVKAFAESDLPEEPIPGPYQIVLALAPALIMSGRYGDDASAAIEHAWTLVLPFYQGKRAYLSQATMLFDLAKHASSPEAPMSEGEARAYVTGGETGNTGETQAGRDALTAIRVPMQQSVAAVRQWAPGELEAARERAQRIHDTTQAVIAAQGVLEEAKAADAAESTDATREAVAAAQAAFDQAAKLQSEAYL